ncbi:MAG: S8 family serine peptidase [Chloroflexi bacterium]|nr:S8 family serine peptidase [Chloroflexota bacterium]
MGYLGKLHPAGTSIVSTLLVGVTFGIILGFVLGLVSPRLVLGVTRDNRPITVIVEMEQPPLAIGQVHRPAGDVRPRGGKKMDLESQESREYLSRIAQDHGNLRGALAQAIPDATVSREFEVVLNGLAVTLPASKIEDLKQLPGVKRISPSRTFHVTLDVSVPLINAPALWSRLGGLSQAGLGKKIAILDTGIDQTQPFLTDPTLGVPSGYPPPRGVGNPSYVTNKVIVAKLYTPPGQTGTLNIEHYHGTHVAGIAAGIPDFAAFDPSFGVTRTISGVAPRAFLMNYKVLLGPGGNGDTPEIIQAIDDAVADGSDVVNMSFGGPPDPVGDPPLFDAIHNGTQAGVVFAAAAGNIGPGSYTLLSPGTSPDVITVGASDKSDYLAGFSSRGPNPDLSIKPDLVAPGVSIFSSLPGRSFGYLSGTSMATPHVAGAAALLKELYPSWTASQVKSALINTAKTPVYGSFPNDTTVMQRGGGRIGLQQAMDPGLTIYPPSFSFGQVNVAPGGANLSKGFTVKDVSGAGGTWTIGVTQVITAAGLQVFSPAPSVNVAPGGTVTFSLSISGTSDVAPGDYEGFVVLQHGARDLHIPFFVRTVSFAYTTNFPLIAKNGVLP